MIKKIIGFIIIVSSLQIVAQRNNTSPYSFFGIGEETTQKTVEEINMGQIGAAYNSPFQLTFSNPASLAHLRLTTYTLAGENKSIAIDDGNNSGTASTAVLSYMAIGFPIGEKAGFAFGLQPNTTVGYSLTEEFFDSDENLTELNLYSGDGGTNRVFMGFGYKLNKNLSIGLEGAYVFGKIENTLLNRREGVQLATMHKTESDVRGIVARGGLQYGTKLNEKIKLNVGAVVNFSDDLSNKGKEYLFSLLNNSGGLINPRDTTVNESFSSTIKRPLRTIISAGLGEENKWYAGIEYSFQNPLEFTDGVLNRNSLVVYEKSNRLSFGGFYTPKFNSITNYWQRATYSAGITLKQTGLMVNNTSINDFGISFGVGLPVGQQISKINLGFELGKRGEISNGLVKENYFNLRLGLTLNDRWFQKIPIN